VRQVCPAGSDEGSWVTLPGCSSSPAAVKSGRPPQYYYLLKSDGNPEHGCVLYVAWHRVLSDLGGMQHFLRTWSQNYQTCCNDGTASHEQPIYADGQSGALSELDGGERDAWFCGRYRVVAHQNLPPSSAGAFPSTPADNIIMVTSSQVVWKNRRAGSNPVSFRHDMTLDSPGFTVGAGGQSVRFEFQGKDGDLVAHFGLLETQTISVAYKKDPSVKMKVFRRNGANLDSLEASCQPHFGDESSLSANDILMAKVVKLQEFFNVVLLFDVKLYSDNSAHFVAVLHCDWAHQARTPHRLRMYERSSSACLHLPSHRVRELQKRVVRYRVWITGGSICACPCVFSCCMCE
jgi:hypothetical protein